MSIQLHMSCNDSDLPPSPSSIEMLIVCHRSTSSDRRDRRYLYTVLIGSGYSSSTPCRTLMRTSFTSTSVFGAQCTRTSFSVSSRSAKSLSNPHATWQPPIPEFLLQEATCPSLWQTNDITPPARSRHGSSVCEAASHAASEPPLGVSGT